MKKLGNRLNQAVLSAGFTALLSSSMLANAEMPEVNFAGFGSIVYGKTLSDEDEGEIGNFKAIDTEGEYRDFNVLGLRMTSDLQDNLTFGAQLVAYGHKDYDPEFDWIYINYAFNDHWNVSIGRTRTPLYLYSDYIDVTHAQPWTSQPLVLYSNSVINTVEGLNFTYLDEIGDWSSTLQLYAGGTEEKVGEGLSTDLILNDMAGFAWTLEDDYWRIRTSYSRFDITLGGEAEELTDTLLLIDSLIADDLSGLAEMIATDKVAYDYVAFGAVYDDGTVFGGVEVGRSTSDDSIMFAGGDSGYIFVGYRFNPQWEISLTYGEEEMNENDYAPEVVAAYDDAMGTVIPTGDTTYDYALLAIGDAVDGLAYLQLVRERSELVFNVRWNFHPMASLKLDLVEFSEEIVDTGDKREPNGFRLGLDFIF